MSPSSEFRMSKLIRSKATRLFLTTNGRWTDQVQNAAHFQGSCSAHNTVQKLHLREVELYYLFNQHATSRYDFTIPLN